MREATVDDIPHVLRLTCALVRAINGPQEVIPSHAATSILRLIQQPTGVVFVTDRGFIAGEVAQTIINPQPVAIEHGWYAEDLTGISLLRMFEMWASENGCESVKISTPPLDKKMTRLLRRFGYQPAETAWFK